MELRDGIIVPLVTPLTEEGELDAAGVAKHVERLIAAGVDGLFVMGRTGEFQFLPDRIQLEAIKAVVHSARGRVPVVAGVTGRSVEETMARVMRVEALPMRPDAVVLSPLVYHSNRGLPDHIRRLVKVIESRVILYNNIGIVERRWKRKDIIPGIVGELSELDGVIGLKDSSGNLEYFRSLLAYQRASFKLFQGEESILEPSLRLGASGGVPSIANIAPGLCTRLLRSFRERDYADAALCQREINHIHDLYVPGGNVPAVLKEVLRQEGIIRSPRTAGLSTFDARPLAERVRSVVSQSSVTRSEG